MGKYFVYNKPEEKPEHPEHLKTIRAGLAQVGILKWDVTDLKLEVLWGKFSDTYDAGFLIPYQDLITEFAAWLDKYED